MTTDPDPSTQDPPPTRDEEWVAQRWPAAGPAPTNEVVVDPDAPDPPNIAHPH